MNSNKFKAAHLNIWSLLPKFNSLKDFILHNEYDIFALSETWLNKSISNDLLHIGGYTLIRKDRGSRGGGVAFYLKDTYGFRVIDNITDIEQLWIVTTINRNNVIFGVCYNPPRTNPKQFTDNLEIAISNSVQHGDKVFCFGDININLLDISLNSTRYFLSMLESLEFEQVIDEATHTTATNASLLDVIICNDRYVVSDVKVGGLDISNHALIQCQIAVESVKPSPAYVTYRDFKYFNENEFLADLERLPLDNIFYMDDIDAKVDYFTSNLLDIFNKHVPLRTVRITKKRAPWLTESIKLLMRRRDRARSDCNRKPTPAKWHYYKQLRNATNHALNREKLAYFNYIATNKDSKSLWGELKTLNLFSRSRSHQIPRHLSNPSVINDYFIDSVPQHDIDKTYVYDYYQTNNTVMANKKFSLTTIDNVHNILHNLKNSTAGVDLLSVFFIKLCSPYILRYMVHIINSILLDCRFPSSWKVALVTPIPKKSEASVLSELRPISILSALSKVTEKVIEAQVRQHVEEYNILPLTQSGFRPGFSCSTALLHVVDDIVGATDAGKCTLLVLLDYSKAFDTLDHGLLLVILKSCGFDDDVVKLVQSYLTSRSQVVRLGQNLSQSRAITRGVPQGSILGPLLFTIYTSHFTSFLNFCLLHMYADDTQMYYSFYPQDYESAIFKINSDLEKLSEISSYHSLSINPTKSALLLFGKKCDRMKIGKNLNINVNGCVLELSHTAKNLGLILDDTLRFREHICKVIQRAYMSLRLLYPHRQYLNTNTRKMLCDSLVLSQFAYGATVYGPCLDSDSLNRIQRVQNACVRFIFGIAKFEHVSYRLQELRWLNMAGRRKLYALCLYHKIVLSRTPPYLHNKLAYRSDVHNLNIRTRGLLSPPAHKTSFFERCFRYCIYREYNRVPLEAKNMNHLSFKKLIKSHLLAGFG